LFVEEDKQHKGTAIQYDDLNDPTLAQAIGEKALNTLNDELELVEGVYPSFDQEAYLNNCFIDIAPAPLNKQAVEREIDPTEKAFSGFVFKIHANMDPNHRDRLAFIKIVSGTFERNKPYLHVRNNKKLKFSSPNAFFAERKEIVEISYPGDIVGLHDTGNFKIGDSLTSGPIDGRRRSPTLYPLAQ